MLVRRGAAIRRRASARANSLSPPAKGGVGTTTVAVNLAVALARKAGERFWCDADLSGGDATWLCGVEAAHTIGDVFSGRRTVHEVLQPGPEGIQVVPGIWSPARGARLLAFAQQRLLHELDELGRHAEWIVIDAGSGLNHVVRRFWQAADELLLVTTTEAVSIMDAYAAVETCSCQIIQRRQSGPSSISRRSRSWPAACIHGWQWRLQRFLRLELLAGGSIPWDPAVADLRRPRRGHCVREETNTPASQAIRLMAQELAAPARKQYASPVDSTANLICRLRMSASL